MFGKKPILTRDQILSVQDLPRREVDVPEWGGVVYVRTMTGAERDSWEVSEVARRKKTGDASNIRAMLAALTICDSEGTLLFTLADVVALGKKSAAALDRVVDESITLNNLSSDDIEGLEKN